MKRGDYTSGNLAACRQHPRKQAIAETPVMKPALFSRSSAERQAELDAGMGQRSGNKASRLRAISLERRSRRGRWGRPGCRPKIGTACLCRHSVQPGFPSDASPAAGPNCHTPQLPAKFPWHSLAPQGRTNSPATSAVRPDHETSVSVCRTNAGRYVGVAVEARMAVSI